MYGFGYEHNELPSEKIHALSHQRERLLLAACRRWQPPTRTLNHRLVIQRKTRCELPVRCTGMLLFAPAPKVKDRCILRPATMWQ
jgi:hypothetical protein